MYTKKLLAALVFCLPACANANVIYEWKAANAGTPHGMTLELEFTHWAVQRGVFKFEIEREQPARIRPASGLIAVRYTFPSAWTSSSLSGMSYAPRTEAFADGFGVLDMQLRFEPKGLLSGYIYVNNAQHHLEMRSQGSLFTVLDANSDEGMAGAGCGYGTPISCGGATGTLRQVPEPGSLALLGAGLLAALGMRRRRASQRS